MAIEIEDYQPTPLELLRKEIQHELRQRVEDDVVTAFLAEVEEKIRPLVREVAVKVTLDRFQMVQSTERMGRELSVNLTLENSAVSATGE